MKISIITPFYNGNRFLPEYLDTIAKNAQNLRAGDECEAIIVNDSPGVDVRIPGKAWHKISIKVINLPENGGIHNARVRGLRVAGGDFVMFLDQDDKLADDALRVLSETVESSGADLAVSNAVLEQKDGEVLWYRTDYHKKRIWDLRTYIRVGTQIISPGQALINRDSIPAAWEEHILTHNCCDDYFLWLLMLKYGRRAVYMDEPLYVHRYTGDNASGDRDETDASTEEMIEYLRLSLDSTNDSKAVIETLARMTDYKTAFRKAGGIGKIALSLRHLPLLLTNIIYKANTKTPLGFNR